MMTRLMRQAILLRGARLDADGRLGDVLVRGGRVRVAPEIRPESDWEVVDLGGRGVLPGLWDHHVHFDQWSLARERLDLSGVTSAAEAVALVAERLRAEPPEDDLPLVGYGFRDGNWPDVPHKDLLDPVSGEIPVVLVANDLHCCWVNSAAARRYGQAEHPSGLLREDEWDPVMEAISDLPEEALDRWAAESAEAAAARGVVGIVELESPGRFDSWVRRVRAGNRSLRVVCGVWPPRLEDAIARGLRTGDVLPDTDGLVEMGPLKLFADGSLNTRTAYCHDPYPNVSGADAYGMPALREDELVALVERAWTHGLRPAIHAIGDRANAIALDAFAAVGARGSVEHAQLLLESDVRRFAELGVVASVQPEHAMDDRDVAEHHWAGRTGRAYPYAALLAAGARLALGSDAPVAPLDPWISISAACHRGRDGREPWHPEQAIGVEEALAASTRTGRSRLVDGDPADLVIVEDEPTTATPERLRAMPVAGTILDGRWTHASGL